MYVNITNLCMHYYVITAKLKKTYLCKVHVTMKLKREKKRTHTHILHLLLRIF